jgi:hypothetical protein
MSYLLNDLLKNTPAGRKREEKARRSREWSLWWRETLTVLGWLLAFLILLKILGIGISLPEGEY